MIRFFEKISRQPGQGPQGQCWEWQASVFEAGYGAFKYMGKQKKAHRVAFEIENGPIPTGLKVLHSCDNPLCCRPSHLRLGTNAENSAEMVKKGRHHNQAKTHCKAGHEFSDANTRLNSNGSRTCRICHSIRQSLRYHNSK